MRTFSRTALTTPVWGGTYRAAVLGHTGRGGYGHGLDLALVGLPGVEIAAVADPDPDGREGACRRLGGGLAYADYRELLERERPDLVCVAPSWLDQREAMVQACAAAGVRAVYCEKPLARSVEEADRMLAACRRHGTRIAVAHQNRAFPAAEMAEHLLAGGRIGRLRGMRGYTKQDARGGGLEWLIHGTHLFDLMRSFAGNPLWVSGVAIEEDRPAAPQDVRAGPMEVGAVCGSDVTGSIGFPAGVVGTVESMRAGDGGGTEYLHLQLWGSRGILAFWSSNFSEIWITDRAAWIPGRTEAAEVIGPAPAAGWSAPAGSSGSLHPANQLLIGDLLQAVEEGREPRSSGEDARWSLEMIHGAFWSHRRGMRVQLPLADRRHPLDTWGDGE